MDSIQTRAPHLVLIRGGRSSRHTSDAFAEQPMQQSGPHRERSPSRYLENPPDTSDAASEDVVPDHHFDWIGGAVPAGVRWFESMKAMYAAEPVAGERRWCPEFRSAGLGPTVWYPSA